MTPRDAEPGERDQSATSPRAADAVAVAHLATLPPLEYDRIRHAQAEALGCRATTLDAAVGRARAAAGGADEVTHGRDVTLHDPEPWHEAVATAVLLDRLADAVRRHVVLQQSVADVVALWIAHTWVYERFEHTPRLGITSPTKRCGKSTLMEVLRVTGRRTLKADSISPAGVYRTVEALHPLTLLVDEADTFLKDNEELRGILNSGYEHGGKVIRVVERKDGHVPVEFATFAPVALAAIGELPGTLADRAVPIRMERKAPGDTAQKFRAGGNRAALADLARMLARWSRDTAGALPADPPLPDALNDREGDISVPLLSIAAHAGPEWTARARKGLLAVFNLRAEHDRNAESGTLLLADLKAIFIPPPDPEQPDAKQPDVDQITSADLCVRLGGMDHRPWPEWRYGRPITPQQLANALRPFGIRPTTMRDGDRTPKGYKKEVFEAAWSRYLPPETCPGAASGGLDPQHRNIEVAINGFQKPPPATAEPALRPEISPNCSREQQRCGVAGSRPPDRRNGHSDDEVVL